MIDSDFGHWLAGFTDSEGCFDITPARGVYYYCRFTIGLRADDKPVLDQIQRNLGVGRVWLKTSPSMRGSPQATFSVFRKEECVVVRDVFDRFPLRSKKAEDFKLWSQALDYFKRTWDDDKRNAITAIKAQMALNRKYRG